MAWGVNASIECCWVMDTIERPLQRSHKSLDVACSTVDGLFTMKIAIVSARPRAVQLLLYVLRSQHKSVFWVAKTRKDAIAQAQRQSPDVVLIDLALPDCIPTIRDLHREHTCDILVVNESLAREAAQAYAAVAAGALDAVSLPGVNAKGQPVNMEPLQEHLTHLTKQQRPSAAAPRAVHSQATASAMATASITAPLPLPPLIVLGASTGGPMAIATLLTALPADFPAAIVIVQHVNAHFADRLSQWFQRHTPLPVAAAEPGMLPVAGHIFLAAEDRHLVMQPNGILGYRDPSPGLYYCPSVDLFFDSVAKHWKQPGVAVLLTGMGQDGALGMKALRDRGWLTVVQDEASASIHSMPRAAVELGAAMRELPPEQIAALLIHRYT